MADREDDTPRYAPLRFTGNPGAQRWAVTMDRELRAAGLMAADAPDLLEALLEAEAEEEDDGH